MSARPMVKHCIHCHRTYTYNISTGNLGDICTWCGKHQVLGFFDKSSKKLKKAGMGILFRW